MAFVEEAAVAGLFFLSVLRQPVSYQLQRDGAAALGGETGGKTKRDTDVQPGKRVDLGESLPIHEQAILREESRRCCDRDSAQAHHNHLHTPFVPRDTAVPRVGSYTMHHPRPNNKR